MNEFQMDKLQVVWQLIAEIKRRYTPVVPKGDPVFNPPQYYELPETERTEFARTLAFFDNTLKGIGLKQSGQAALDIQPEVMAMRHGVRFSNQNAVDRIGEIERAVKREMKANAFFFMTPNEAEQFRKPFDGWEDVVKRFPDATIDVEESSKSLACERYAGAVFHVMLVSEYGVIGIGNLIGVPDPKINYASVVGEMQRIVHRTKFTDLTPDQQNYHPFLTQVLPLTESMQKAWRNKISHANGAPLILKSGDVSGRIAKDIVDATQAFMRRLAADLP